MDVDNGNKRLAVKAISLVKKKSPPSLLDIKVELVEASSVEFVALVLIEFVL
jgi:hypothetical protein